MSGNCLRCRDRLPRFAQRLQGLPEWRKDAKRLAGSGAHNRRFAQKLPMKGLDGDARLFQGAGDVAVTLVALIAAIEVDGLDTRFSS